MERLGDSLTRARLVQLRRSDSPEPVVEEPPQCPACKDFGFVRRDLPVGDVDFGQAFPCTCKQGDVRDRLRKRSNLGPLASRTFASFRQEGRGELSERSRLRLVQAFLVSQDFAERPQGWLVLSGPSGCGKTHLAAAIANRQIELGHEVFFTVVPDLLDHLRATFAPNSDVSYDDLFESVRNTKLLILDDLGTQSGSPWAQEKLFQILNHRFNAELPTVVTTNHQLHELDDRLRARLEDRLSAHEELRPWDSPLEEALIGDWPAGLRDQRFDNFVFARPDVAPEQVASLREAYELAARFAEEPNGWLVLVGDRGCGKTHLAAAVKNEREQLSSPTLFMTVPDLLDYLRATYAPTSDVTYDRGFDAIRKTPVLILDDYGAHSATPWAEEKLFQLLNYRLNARLPTMITTNVPLDRPETLTLSHRQEERIVSRLSQRGFSTVKRIDAPDYRRPDGAAGFGGDRRPPAPRLRKP